jgi:signal transduction histidine kinase
VEEMNIQLQAGQRIQVNLSGSHSFSTDKRLLKNILINLISNAIKFSFSNSVIELNLQDTPTGKSIEVKDYGMGIPPEDLPHLFSNFSRGSNVNQIQGTGLGLTLVKRYADILKGTVTLHSELGKGTVVTLEIPNLKFP